MSSKPDVPHIDRKLSAWRCEPLRHIIDAVELGCFSERPQVSDSLGALDALLVEGGIAIERPHTNASLYPVVIQEKTGIMQESAQFLSVVGPEDRCHADRAAFQAQYQSPFLSTAYFSKSHHDLIDALSLHAVQCSRR